MFGLRSVVTAVRREHHRLSYAIGHILHEFKLQANASASTLACLASAFFEPSFSANQAGRRKIADSAT